MDEATREYFNPRQLTNRELRAFLDLLMYSDPRPPGVDMEVLEQLADREAWARGFDDWIIAYHGLARHG